MTPAVSVSRTKRSLPVWPNTLSARSEAQHERQTNLKELLQEFAMNASGRQKFEGRRLYSRLWAPVVLAVLIQATFARGADVVVSSVSDLLNAAAQARPGDTVIMQDGLWPDADILFIGNGTQTKPITLRAQTPGQVILSGGSRLRLAGEYLAVDGLKFANGYLVSG